MEGFATTLYSVSDLRPPRVIPMAVAVVLVSTMSPVASSVKEADEGAKNCSFIRRLESAPGSPSELPLLFSLLLIFSMLCAIKQHGPDTRIERVRG